MSDLKKLGPQGEAFALSLLKKRGDKLVARNFACPQGELDLVTWHKETLVFTEVRARSTLAFGSPAETVTKAKQNKIRRAANWFCVQKVGGRKLPPSRFGVIWLLSREGKILE